MIKPIKKAIERRENKKLDFERYNKQVENAKAKKTKSDRYGVPLLLGELGHS